MDPGVLAEEAVAEQGGQVAVAMVPVPAVAVARGARVAAGKGQDLMATVEAEMAVVAAVTVAGYQATLAVVEMTGAASKAMVAGSAAGCHSVCHNPRSPCRGCSRRREHWVLHRRRTRQSPKFHLHTHSSTRSQETTEVAMASVASEAAAWAAAAGSAVVT